MLTAASLSFSACLGDTGAPKRRRRYVRWLCCIFDQPKTDQGNDRSSRLGALRALPSANVGFRRAQKVASQRQAQEEDENE